MSDSPLSCKKKKAFVLRPGHALRRNHLGLICALGLSSGRRANLCSETRGQVMQMVKGLARHQVS